VESAKLGEQIIDLILEAQFRKDANRVGVLEALLQRGQIERRRAGFFRHRRFDRGGRRGLAGIRGRSFGGVRSGSCGNFPLRGKLNPDPNGACLDLATSINLPVVATSTNGTTFTCVVGPVKVYSCPTGATLSGTSCIAPVTQGASISGYTCASGTLSGSSCVTTSTTAATANYSCPSGDTLSGSSCLVVSRTRYEPYGKTAAGTPPTWIGFTGHVNDADTGLVYMQQRYYDPIAARFLSTDPVTTDANTGTAFGRYVYAQSNPYRYTDPDGREEKAQTVTGSHIAGAGRTGTLYIIPGNMSGGRAAAGAKLGALAGGVQSRGSALNDPNFFSPQEGANGPVFVDNTGAMQNTGSSSARNGNYLAVAAIADMMSEVTGGLSTVASFVEATVRSAAEFAHSFGTAGLAFGTLADVASSANGGISRTQAGLNLGVGVATVSGGPLTALGGAQYFLGNTLYNHLYEGAGGSQQGWANLGVALQNMAQTGLGP
jgi:RHS repeat-associated protein